MSAAPSCCGVDLVGPVREQVGGGAGLDVDRRHRVGDAVVQILGDAKPFVGDRLVLGEPALLALGDDVVAPGGDQLAGEHGCQRPPIAASASRSPRPSPISRPAVTAASMTSRAGPCHRRAAAHAEQHQRDRSGHQRRSRRVATREVDEDRGLRRTRASQPAPAARAAATARRRCRTHTPAHRSPRSAPSVSMCAVPMTITSTIAATATSSATCVRRENSGSLCHVANSRNRAPGPHPSDVEIGDQHQMQPIHSSSTSMVSAPNSNGGAPPEDRTAR